ncbi:MAG: tRNA (5-methylaminomethyl-2-thiouridine)(34)-methyltransferase MnmD [Proteiniphilum sp.]
MERILEISEDGSHTLFVPSLNEHYHSTRGAIRESRHVFIEAGLQPCDKQEIELLEIGFGTGLNALLTLLEAEERGKRVTYTAIERYPLGLDDAKKLNYAEQLVPTREELFLQLHTSAWGDRVEITPTFHLKKLKVSAHQLSEFHPETLFNVIYYDAFAPGKQPEMWTIEIFERLYALSDKGAPLTTYCAKGDVRRMLQTVGYRVERLPGPPGKREMLRATKVATEGTSH